MSMTEVLDFNDTGPPSDRPISTALAYASRGWPVFPCNPLTKAPLTEHGFKEATTDAFKIRGWWARWPQAMIGVPTGRTAGFWVLDIDEDKERGKSGVASLSDMGHDLAELMDTAVAVTGSGGYHCLFRFDPERPIGNSRGALKRFLDVRGEGGYIVAAGSTRADGRRYSWLNPPDENEIADAPEWLLEVISSGGVTPANQFDFNDKGPTSKAPAERVAAVEPGTWHENTRDLVARMVREGASDETIAAIAPRFTLGGYTDAQTVAEFLTHARTARAKWGYQPKNLEAEHQAAQSDVFRFLTIAELATLKPPEWRIDGIFPCHGSSTIYGAYETYKTFVALDMLLSLACGRDWMGHAVKPCSVVYIAGEGQHGLAQRILGWCAAKNGGRQPANFLLLPEAVAVPHTGNLDKLLRSLDGLSEAPGVVALDTITRMSAGGSLNDEKDMQQYVLGMDRLRRHTGGHIMNVGHSGKDKERGLLGSIVLPAAMETIICIERSGDALTLINSHPKGKQKDGPNFEDIRMRKQKVLFEQAGQAVQTLVFEADEGAEEGALQPDERPRSEPSGKPQGANQAAIMAALKKAKGEPLGLTRLMTMTGKPNDAVFHAVRSLAAKGLIQEVGGEGAKRWVID